MHRDSRKEGLKEGWKGTRTRLWDALLSPWQQADKACGCCSMKSKSDAPNFRQFYKININTLCGIIKYVDTPFRLVERWLTTWEGNNNYYYSQFFLLKRERREAVMAAMLSVLLKCSEVWLGVCAPSRRLPSDIHCVYMQPVRDTSCSVSTRMEI